MKHTITVLRGAALLAAIGLCCAETGAAYAQRAGRQGGRASFASTGSTGSSTSSTSCPNGGTSTSSGSTTGAGSTTSTSTSTSGTTSSAAALAAQRSAFLTQGIAGSAAATSGQSASAFAAQLVSPNQVLVRWSGSTANAQRVFLGVLNANGQVISQQAVSQLPVQATLAVTNAARYYGVRVIYTNGTSSTYYSPIR